ncbi:MAG: NAD(P)/FAD-dependent oxidoreductase [Erysipelotrichaceae bacterium]|nr:NAD(P)/FAD-dependent oxidoreductase [Erysipelotrichaceae bacterium]
MNSYNVVIVGGGSAGLAAAKQCYDLGIKKIVIMEKDAYLGGILNQCIHNGFGLHEFKEQLSGPEYAYRFIEMLKDTDVEIKLNTTVTEITKDKHVIYTNEEEGYQEIEAKTIIFALGCFERNAGAIQLPGDRPIGVFSAGTAQKYLNIDGYLVGKRVFILGSGDIGLIMARRMTLEGAKVLGVAEIMPYSNGLNRNIVQCLNDFNIPLYLSHTVTNVIGKEKLERIELSKVDEHFTPIKGSEQYFDVDVLLLSIGLTPVTDLLTKLGIAIHPRTKGPIVNEHNETSVKGVFVAGNGLHVHDLVDFVSNEARLASQGAYAYLNNRLHYGNEVIKTEAKVGIGYVVPQIINYLNVKDKVTLKFRATKPFKNVDIIIKADDEIIKKVYKMNLIPSEMENIEISRELFNENTKVISVEVKER